MADPGSGGYTQVVAKKTVTIVNGGMKFVVVVAM